MTTQQKKSDTARFLSGLGLTAGASFSFPLNASLSINTVVSGAANSIAVVSIVNGSLTLWSATLLQTSNVAKLPFAISAGGTTIEPGAIFTMTIPTALQTGNILVQLTMSSGTQPPTPANLQVATWSLPS